MCFIKLVVLLRKDVLENVNLIFNFIFFMVFLVNECLYYNLNNLDKVIIKYKVFCMFVILRELVRRI